MKFSIAIPAYKRKFLKEAVQSCIDQSYEDFELIILDDASPENLSDILDLFDDPRIRRFRNETNVGAVNVVNNWNKCLELARGDYFICMGDDDVLLPKCLEQYRNVINRFPDTDVFHMRTQIINETSEIVSLLEERPEQEDVFSMVLERWKGRRQYVGDFCYKSSSLIKSGGFFPLPLAWGSDDITAAKMAMSGGVVNCNFPGFQYRVNSQSISSSKNLKLKFEALMLESEWYAATFDSNSPIGKIISSHFKKVSEDYVYEALWENQDYYDWHKKAKQANISNVRYGYLLLKAYLKRFLGW